MNTLLPKYSNWKPLSLADISLKLREMEWILAGGYALELFYGAAYRPHGDIDIIIKRTHQNQILKYFDNHQLFVAYKGSLSPFSKEEYYQKPIQDIWVLSENRQYWCLQIMLVDELDGNWIYKRNSSIQLPFEEIYFEKEGIKILKPEIQLLYKSATIRKKDQLDFETVYQHLSFRAKKWLRNCLEMGNIDKHIWLK